MLLQKGLGRFKSEDGKKQADKCRRCAGKWQGLSPQLGSGLDRRKAAALEMSGRQMGLGDLGDARMGKVSQAPTAKLLTLKHHRQHHLQGRNRPEGKNWMHILQAK